MQKTQSLRPSPTAMLNPRLDPTFKAMFTQGTKESDAALMSFISAAIGKKVKRIRLDPNEPAVDTPQLVQMTFDVAATFDDGEKADIEIQGREQQYDYAVRAEIQAARLLNNNAKKGGCWKANKVYQISVLNFHLKKGDKEELLWYTMRNDKGGELAGRINVIFIDLLEFKKLYGAPVEKLSALQKWGLYLSFADDAEKYEYIQSVAKSEEGLMEANRIAQRMSEEDAAWFRQNSIDMYLRDYNSNMAAVKEQGLELGKKEGRQIGLKIGIRQGMKEGVEQGLQQGIQQGLQQGLEKKAVEDAKSFYKNGVSIEIIARSLNMTLERVQEIVTERQA